MRLLIDGVLSNRAICKAHTLELIAKLASEGGKYFKNEEGKHFFLAVPGKRVRRNPQRIPAEMKIMFRGHPEVGDIALTISRRRQFPPYPLPAFRNKNSL